MDIRAGMLFRELPYLTELFGDTGQNKTADTTADQTGNRDTDKKIKTR
jgi:hypothetical protein